MSIICGSVPGTIQVATLARTLQRRERCAGSRGPRSRLRTRPSKGSPTGPHLRDEDRSQPPWGRPLRKPDGPARTGVRLYFTERARILTRMPGDFFDERGIREDVQDRQSVPGDSRRGSPGRMKGLVTSSREVAQRSIPPPRDGTGAASASPVNSGTPVTGAETAFARSG